MISASTFLELDSQTTYINPVQASWYADYLEGLKPMTTESDFYQRLKRNLPDFDFQRIETTTQAGVFDCVVHHDVAMFWLELKVAPNVMSPSQYAWAAQKRGKCPNLFLLTLYPAKKQLALEHLNTKRSWTLGEKGRTFDWSALADKILMYATHFK
jgi:hypothetical protein